jgi:riboflavin biosynthesis pyrimidine reductase
MTGIRRLWPDPGLTNGELTNGELTEAELVDAYATDRSRPWLRVNFVSSLDGAVSGGDGFSAGLSGPADRQVFGLLRMTCDALLVGAGTLRHEGYHAVRLDDARRRWRLEHGLPEYPVLVVVSRSLQLDPGQHAFTAAPVRPLVLTSQSAPADRRVLLAPVADVLDCGASDVDLALARTVLLDRGLGQVLCEGGPHVLGSLTAADLVDELCLTLAPLLVGPGPARITAGPPPSQPRGLALRQVLTGDDMLLLRYARPGSPTAASNH